MIDYYRKPKLQYLKKRELTPEEKAQLHESVESLARRTQAQLKRLEEERIRYGTSYRIVL